MGVIRCPECNLINTDKTSLCRRCGTCLSSASGGGDVFDSKLMNFNRATRPLAIPVIVIVSLLCVYGYYRYSRGGSNSVAGLAETNEVKIKSAPAKQELEGVKKLCRDFIAKLDQNAADLKGDGFNKNQVLAYNMIMLLNDQQNKLIDPKAKSYSEEFCRLAEQYYDQLVRFNLQTAHLAESKQRVASEIAQVQADPSLQSEDKISRKADLQTEIINELEERNLIAKDMDETVKSLRDLSASSAAS